MAIDKGRVVCDACGVVHEEATATIAMLERKRTALDAQITKLHALQDVSLRRSPNYEPALRVLDEWKAVLSPKAREVYSTPRLKLTIARLDGGFTEDELKECIAGYATVPYVDATGKRSSAGEPKQLHVDVDLIFRDAKHVEMGHRYALSQVVAAPTPSVMSRLPWRKVWATNKLFIEQALVRQFGKGLTPLDGGWLEWPCPRCVALGHHRYHSGELTLAQSTDPMVDYARYGGHPLYVQQEPGQTLAECQVCALGEEALLAAIAKQGD